jgi:hypothetical protein
VKGAEKLPQLKRNDMFYGIYNESIRTISIVLLPLCKFPYAFPGSFQE